MAFLQRPEGKTLEYKRDLSTQAGLLKTLQVHPSATRPHQLARIGPEAGIFVRVGSTTRRADAAQIEEMARFGQVGSFDEQPIP